MSGTLLFPVGYAPVDDNGALVPAGKLHFTRTGTSTTQNTYSDSALSTPNANPVVLNSAGRLATKVYGNPDSGYDYRIRLTTSADVEIWSFDDIKCDGAGTANVTSGAFTGTLTGMSGATTGTIYYSIFSNSSGTGQLCVLSCPAGLTGTSNTTAMTMTGIPSDCAPVSAIKAPTLLTDNSTGPYIAEAVMSAAGTTITFGIDQPASSTGFTNTNSKGLPVGWLVVYPLT